MNRLQSILKRAGNDLAETDHPWCVVGGLAVSVWCEPRLTRDIDLAVAVDGDEQAEALIRRLREKGYALEELVEQEATGRLATARFSLVNEPNGIVVDLLFASSGIEAEACAEAVLVEVFEDLEVPVAARPHLIVMKLLARDDRSRPVDADDLRLLVGGATREEIDLSLSLVDLVSERGFDRGRNLRRDLEGELAAGSVDV